VVGGCEATRVGILGSGVVGQALGKGFVSCGYETRIGSRTPGSARLRSWARKAGGKASTGTFAQTAAYGEMIVLATLGAATEEIIDLAGPSNFRGKLLVDVTNPLDFSKGMPPGLFVGLTDSLGERIQRKLPQAKVVKCFNTVGNSQMVNPTFKDVEMLICGDDPEAKRRVEGMLKEFGWKGAIDVGGIDGARWLEALVPLWVRVGARLDSRNHVFKVLHGSES
jgi:predicted dinucleotide-binding enzyme